MNEGMKSSLVIKLVLLFILVGCSSSPKKSKVITKGEDRIDINLSMQPRLFLVRQCYLDAVSKNKKLSGPMRFTWEIHKGGVARKVKIVPGRKTLKNVVMQNCLSNIIAKTDFQEPPENTVIQVSYHFAFESNFKNSGLVIREQ